MLFNLMGQVGDGTPAIAEGTQVEAETSRDIARMGRNAPFEVSYNFCVVIELLSGDDAGEAQS